MYSIDCFIECIAAAAVTDAVCRWALSFPLNVINVSFEKKKFSYTTNIVYASVEMMVYGLCYMLAVA